MGCHAGAVGGAVRRRGLLGRRRHRVGALNSTQGANMSDYVATVHWQRHDESFTDNRYSRRHAWYFDGGVTVPASSAPQSVPPPGSDLSCVDPEEAFVASLSSCHMLWFLALAAKRRFCVDSYIDDATGVMARNASGKLAITVVTLRPKIVFVGDRLPTKDEMASLHHQAHAECF